MEDTMENVWGVKYVTIASKRNAARTFSNFREVIQRTVPGFTLYSVQICGTDANSVAISLATGYNYNRCLFGIGCYIGGDERHQMLSSSGQNCGLALPKRFEDNVPTCQELTIPLPYYIPCEAITEQQLRLHERRCLLHLHQRLLHAQIIGKPFKALLLEYVLGGNGGELSAPFLEDLGKLLKHYNVVVIADEILTGGRVESVVLSTTTPKTFRDCILLVTMGKIVGRGLVLLSRRSSTLTLPLRGFSTPAECEMPCHLYEEVITRIQGGMIKTRRDEVLKLMNCQSSENKEDAWGQGLQIYTTYTRSSIRFGLRNRLLPRLEQSKLRKNGATRSKWNCSTVCTHLMTISEGWIVNQQLRLYQGEYIFYAGLTHFLFSRASTDGAGQKTELYFKNEEVENFLGMYGKKMADIYRESFPKAQGRRMPKLKTSTLVARAIGGSILNTQETRAIYRKRVGNARVQYNVFNLASFEIYN